MGFIKNCFIFLLVLVIVWIIVHVFMYYVSGYLGLPATKDALIYTPLVCGVVAGIFHRLFKIMN